MKYPHNLGHCGLLLGQLYKSNSNCNPNRYINQSLELTTSKESLWSKVSFAHGMVSLWIQGQDLEPYLCAGCSHTITMTFSKGGATDFARVFFRLTEGTGTLITGFPLHTWITSSGRLVTEVEEPQQRTGPMHSPEQDKKNKWRYSHTVLEFSNICAIMKWAIPINSDTPPRKSHN